MLLCVVIFLGEEGKRERNRETVVVGDGRCYGDFEESGYDKNTNLRHFESVF